LLAQDIFKRNTGEFTRGKRGKCRFKIQWNNYKPE